MKFAIFFHDLFLRWPSFLLEKLLEKLRSDLVAKPFKIINRLVLFSD